MVLPTLSAKPDKGQCPPTAEQTLLRVPISLDPSGHLTTKTIQDVQVGDRMLTRNQKRSQRPHGQTRLSTADQRTPGPLFSLIAT